ncbi:uncharacterized protein C8R40DRAFT_1027462, partial [Lentinula edodes]|uniref:uncharacterized protein n=1 Tax=Lentinula edodes TaxID=5353 RepID=UPI001E8D80BD
MVGIPKEILGWIQRQYAQRKTQLSFDDYISLPFSVPGGEDQGDPFAAVGYILYAAGLLRLVQAESREQGFGFMDDVAGMKWAKGVDELHAEIGDMMSREGRVLDWATAHNCHFGVTKFKLVD